MKTIKVTTQAELDALPKSFSEYTIIEIHGGTPFSKIQIVEARGNSSVEAWDNSSVEARGNSSVVARGNSSVVAWGNSSVEAWGNVAVHNQSPYTSLELWAFSVAWLVAKAKKVARKSKTAQVITPKRKSGVSDWLENEGLKPEKGSVVVFKRVSRDYKTQEGTSTETAWIVGSTVSHPSWKPDLEECGAGKYHACSRPYFCDEFRDKKDDVYVAIRVKVADLYVWPNPSYPHKVSFREGVVLNRCDKLGREVK